MVCRHNLLPWQQQLGGKCADFFLLCVVVPSCVESRSLKCVMEQILYSV